MSFLGAWQETFAWLMPLVTTFVLASVIIVTSFVRRNSIERQMKVLTALAQTPLAGTRHYVALSHNLQQLPQSKALIGQATLPSLFPYKFPTFFLFFIVLLCALVTFLGARFESYYSVPSFVLGGMKVIGSAEGLAFYQRGTVAVGAWAFMGAYIVVINTLMKRVNNNDMDPISYYFLSAHVLVACVVGAVARHAVAAGYGATPGTDQSPEMMLVVIGFAVGLKPYLFVDDIYSWIQARLGRGQQPRQPNQANLPESMPLQMIEGLPDEKQQRLRELDIDNCQYLAQENPFAIWARTSYKLQHVIDWIAQAQLYALMKQDGVMRLRQLGIRDIFMLQRALGDAAAIQVVSNTTSIAVAVLDQVRAALAQDPAFVRLEEVRAHM